MKTLSADKSKVQIGVVPEEAALLLQGLEAQRAELGSIAEELIELLRAKGVRPPPSPDHIRTEFLGPEG
ncbi:MAG: hypothetical protein M0T84_18760 [Betaproteobacteria bacterium]|nr:hypothetical protein [Betaproteobacteria bacterium]